MKTKTMDDGTVSFKNRKHVELVKNVARDRPFLAKIYKTMTDDLTVDFEKQRKDRDREERKKVKEAAKKQEKEDREKRKKALEDKKARDYDVLFDFGVTSDGPKECEMEPDDFDDNFM
ncbi:Jlp2/Ccd25 like protein [Aduncisulcus paluster]|nr:Jlp2/Ccd25 like protein [Aduncisulcus paluster]